MDMVWRLFKLHKYIVEDILLFPQSPINILSVNCFIRQLNDMMGTGINTHQLQYPFYQESDKFLLTMQHLPSNLPEISINEGFVLSTTFPALVSRAVNVSNHPRYGCCFTHTNADDENKDNFTSKLGEHSKCCHSKSAFTTSHNHIISYFFEIGEILFLTNDRWSGLIMVKYFSLDEAKML